MVTLNLTLLVELGLFLLFMGAMHRLVVKPLLRVMDEREERIAADRSGARQQEEESARLEREYSDKIVALHRKASREIVRAHRDTQDAHNMKVRELQKREEVALNEERKQLRAQLEAGKSQHPELIAVLVQAMTEGLGLERGRG